MSNIRILFKDGSEKRFEHVGRPGGSYTKSLRREGGFVIVKDEWGRELSYPAEDIKEVEETPNRSR